MAKPSGHPVRNIDGAMHTTRGFGVLKVVSSLTFKPSCSVCMCMSGAFALRPQRWPLSIAPDVLVAGNRGWNCVNCTWRTYALLNTKRSIKKQSPRPMKV